MRERSGLLAAFLGIGAFLYHTGAVNEPAKPGPPATSVSTNASADDQPSDWEFLKNFDEFYEPGRPCRVNTKSTKFSGAVMKSTACEKQCRKLLRDRFDWMIATVPDPELSEMKLDFD